ncbi:MAG: DinB family protein [Bacteroidota bacterium]
MIEVPKTSELSTYYQSYLKYVNPGDDLLHLIKNQKGEMAQFLASIPEDKATIAYAPGKWMLKEVVGHVCDTERIMSYRSLRIARKDRTPLPGFDENTYMTASNYRSRSLKNIAEELRTVREATITLIENFSPEMIDLAGIANENEISVRANLYMIFVHAQHHMAIIKERYLA